MLTHFINFAPIHKVVLLKSSIHPLGQRQKSENFRRYNDVLHQNVQRL